MKTGWSAVALNQVCTLINGKAYKKAELLSEGKYKVLRVGNFFTNRSWYYSDLELPEDKYCDDGDLLYAWSASFGPQLWDGGKTIYHYHIWKVEVDEELMDKSFLYYFFEWDKEKIKSEQGAGATMIHVSMRSMNAREINLPPLEEQKRIVAVLDAAFEGLDRARAHTEANLQNARDLFAKALSNKLSAYDIGWVEKTIADVCTIRSGTTVSKSLELSQGTVPYVKVADMNLAANIPNITTSSRFLDRSKVNPKSVLPIGATIFPKRGGAIKTNKKRFLEVETCVDLNTMGVFSKSELQDEFLYWYFQNINMAELGSGSSIPQINNYDIEPLVIVYPKDIEDQKNIAEGLLELSEKSKSMQNLYQSKLTDLDDLRQSLLQKAFAGELT